MARTFATCPRCKRDVETVVISKRTAYADHNRPGTKKSCLPRYESVTTAMWKEPEPTASAPAERLEELQVEGLMETAIKDAVGLLGDGEACVLVNRARKVTVRRRGDETVVERDVMLQPAGGVALF